MRKLFLGGLTLALLQSVAFAGGSLYQPVTKQAPKTFAEYKARTIARVDWAEKKVKQLGRVKAVLFFNKFDQQAPVNDFIFAYVCNGGKNNDFILANKNLKTVFVDLYDNPNHVKLRKAYKKQPNGAWVSYPNPIQVKGEQQKTKYAYVRVLPKYKLCIGSGFSL